MSTSLKKYFPAGTPVKWSASAENYITESGKLILNDDTTLNIELKRNFSRDYWVVVEANNNPTSISRVRYFKVYTKNHGTLSLRNLSEVGKRFYGIRKSDYPDLQWDYINHSFNDSIAEDKLEISYFKQMQIDFGNQIITGGFPIHVRSAASYPYLGLVFEDLYIFGGDGIQSYNGRQDIAIGSFKIFSKVPSNIRFSGGNGSNASHSFTGSLYVQNPPVFTTGFQMFAYLYNCSMINIEDFDFSNIKDVRWMFDSAYFKGADSYPLFDTSHITDMRGMFGNGIYQDSQDGLLNNVPLYDTSNVTDMRWMFEGRRIDVVLPKFNTSKVTTMRKMFERATINTSLPNWDTSNVTDMVDMFYKATINVTLPNWNTSNVTNMSRMFGEMHRFDTTLPNWNTSNVTNMSEMFYYVWDITSTLPNWDTSNVTNMSRMFYNVNISSPLPNWNTSKVTYMSEMFYQATISHPLPNWDTSNVTDMVDMFYKATMSPVFPNWDTSNVTNMAEMFYECKNLTDVRLDMSSCTEAYDMFYGCTSLSNLYISNLKTSLDLYYCPLTHNSALFIINNLQTVPSADRKYINFGKSTFDTLSSAEIAKATNKGWTIQ